MAPGGARKKNWSPDKNLAPARPPEAKFLSGGQFFFPGAPGAHFFRFFFFFIIFLDKNLFENQYPPPQLTLYPADAANINGEFFFLSVMFADAP